MHQRLTVSLGALRGLLARPLASYYLLLASVGLLVSIGLVMVLSATSVSSYVTSGNAFAVVAKQTMWALLGIVGFWMFQRLPVRTYRSIGAPLMMIAIPIQLIMLIGGEWGGKVDEETGVCHGCLAAGPLQVDAEGIWLHFGSLQVQPAEFAKLALIFWTAEILVRKSKLLTVPRELALPLFPVAGLLLILVGFHDLGTMVTMLIAFGALLWVGGVRGRFLGLLGGVAAAGVVILILVASYRGERLEWFLHPELYAAGGGRQTMQSYYAISQGGWFGVGLGASSLKWGHLPESANDFIYAIVAEELGVIGCVVILALFAVLTYAGLRIAHRSADPFRRVVAGATTIWLASQAIVNIAVVIGLVPITGVTLPFISAGGSSLVVSLAAVGMLASFARSEPEAVVALHARPPGRWSRLLWAPLPPLPAAGRVVRGRDEVATPQGSK